jgi:hypothetical protein
MMDTLHILFHYEINNLSEKREYYLNNKNVKNEKNLENH